MNEEHMQEASDTILVTRALTDEKQAFNLLIERYQAMALFLALRYVGEREIAYDLVQEAFLQAYLSLSRLRDPARFKSWFYGIVLNLCRNWRREQVNMPDTQELARVETALLVTDPAEIVEERELRQVLREAVEVLSPSNRTVALLFYYEDQSIQSIAELLHISPTAVRNRLLKGREQLRFHLKTVYPEMLVTTTRSYRRLRMIPMTVANVTRHEKMVRTTVILVDAQRQRGLLLWFTAERDFSSQVRMSTSTEQKSAVVESGSAELIVNILQALHGTLEVIEIDTLETDILYARIKLRGPDGSQESIKARLGSALPLLVEARCPVMLAEEVLERQGIGLKDFGQTFEEQIDALVRQGQQSFSLGSSQALAPVKVPRNLDFTEEFRGWSFMGYPETPKQHEYHIDKTVTFQNKPSLAIILQEQERSLEETSLNGFALLMHEGFIADNYQGKRLRMVAYARANHVEQGVFSVHINGPAREGAQERKTMYMADNQAHPVEGTCDWSLYEVVIDVPIDAVTIQCSFNLTRYGEVWLDGFRFETVDLSVPLTGTRIIPPPRQPSNLAFEQNFDGWLMVGGRPQDYTRSIELAEAGAHIAHLKNAVEPVRGNCELQQRINAYDYRGKTVQFSARVRSEGVSEQASLYLALGLANKTRIERIIQGTSSWQVYEMSLFVPDAPGQMQFGLMLYGPGQIWLRDVQFSVLDAS